MIERRIERKTLHNRWGDVVAALIHLPTVNDFAVIDQLLNTFEVSIVDDVTVRIGLERIARIERLPSFDDLWN